MPMRGAKWMREASYLSDADRELIMREVEACKRYCKMMAADRVVSLTHQRGYYDPRHVGVRVATYCGEPHPIAVVTYGPGGCMMYGSVYRTQRKVAA